MRIIYCTDTICHPGGIQRTTIAKANALAEVDGYEVWIVVTDHKLSKPILEVSDKVHIIDLDINYYEDDWKSRWHVLKGILVKRRLHRKRLKDLLTKIHPDVVISTGTSEKYFLPGLKLDSTPAFIREIHYTSDYRIRSARGWFEILSAWAGDLIDYRFSINRYDKIVVLTREDKETHWKGNDKVVTIPNPLSNSHGYQSSLTNKIVISAGRFVPVKDFSSLIQSWATVHERHSEWRLEIWGDGGLRKTLQEEIKGRDLEGCVSLPGYADDILQKFAEASIFVCSSQYEGFSLSILEAMLCGLPVVSFACPYGPREMIQDGENGFLVPVGDAVGLADSIIRMIEDESLRYQMGHAAKAFSEKYDIDIILGKWRSLFLEITDNKRR